MRKFTKTISLLLFTTLLLGLLGAVSIHAESEYEIRDVEAYIYTPEKTAEVGCLFVEDLPDVPYLDPTDYLNILYIDQYSKENAEGVCTVTSVKGDTMVIDSNSDSVTFENYDAFIDCKADTENVSDVVDFIQYVETRYTEEAKAVTVDLARYSIDIIEYDNRVYIPLSVLGAMFSSIYNNAVYYDGKLCFVHSFDDNSYYYDLDISYYYENLTRTRAMADFTYKNLCLYFDYFFGKPSNALITGYLEELGFDGFLDEYSDISAFTKELLLSENMAEYICGFCILQKFCFDGGHTLLFNQLFTSWSAYPDSLLIKAWADILYSENDIAPLVWDSIDYVYDDFDFFGYINDIRIKEYEKYADEIAKEWEGGSFLILHGKAAVYVFDIFKDYTPKEFAEALQLAYEYGAEVFILDDSCNGGGLVESCEFINTMITNKTRQKAENESYYQNPMTGAVKQYVNRVDLNLDGEFNEEDDAFYYDFEFAVLTSHASFSCGNYLPVYAKKHGIAILGATSGGGSCCVTERYMADGLMYLTADLLQLYIEGVDFDLGAEPDCVLTVENEDGSLDYTGFYDIDQLIKITKQYYGTYVPEPVEYTVTEGAGAEWKDDSDKGLSFTSDADFDKFESVIVDGAALDPDDYTVSAGSTVVTLKVDYLLTLDEGEHTLTIVSSDGEASTVFTVTPTPPPEVIPPPTKSSESIILLIFVSAFAAVGIYKSLTSFTKKRDF